MFLDQVKNCSFVTMETVTLYISSSEKYLFGFNHSNFVVKTDFFKKEQSFVNISYLLQQHTKLFYNRSYFNSIIQYLLSVSKIMNLLGH